MLDLLVRTWWVPVARGMFAILLGGTLIALGFEIRGWSREGGPRAMG